MEITKPWLKLLFLPSLFVIALIGCSESAEDDNPASQICLSPTGSGASINDPIHICSEEDFNKIRDGLDKHYALGVDLDLIGTSTSGHDFYNSGAGWEPIGRTGTTAFSGSFDGGGNTISNLTIDRVSEDEVGLFGLSSSSSIIKNFNLVTVDIKGQNYVGSVIGHSYGQAINIHVRNGSISGDGSVGGVIGRLQGPSGLAENSSAENVPVTAGGGFGAGGFVGWSFLGAKIRNSHTTSDVTNLTGTATGGFVGGFKDGLIENSYATGNVQGLHRNGGFAGYSYPEVHGEQLEIKNSFSTGDVTGTGNLTGGFIGRNGHGAIFKSYSSGNVTGVNDVGGFAGDQQWSPCEMEDIYATGNVTGSGEKIGGLIGYNNAGCPVRNAYASGNVHGDAEDVGGLIGRNTTSKIFNVFATGEVTTNTGARVGALIGSKHYAQSEINNAVFYEPANPGMPCVHTDTHSGTTDCSSTSDLSDFENLNLAPLNGWDFSNIWKINIGTLPSFK